jgi:outer membrane lipoprotein-sorting protein
MKYSMNLVFKHTALIAVAVFFAASTAFAHVPVQQSETDTPQFDRLRTMFEDNRVFAASFSHEYNDSFTGEQQHAEGRIWIGKDRYKIDGDNQLMVVDGDVSRVYDGVKNRLIISDYIEEEDDFAPSRMLQGVDESYAISEETMADGRHRIIMRSDDPFAIFTEVHIILNTDGSPHRIMAIDQVDNELITEFSGGEFIDSDEELFLLTFPEDAEKIDLRQGS